MAALLQPVCFSPTTLGHDPGPSSHATRIPPVSASGSWRGAPRRVFNLRCSQSCRSTRRALFRSSLHGGGGQELIEIILQHPWTTTRRRRDSKGTSCAADQQKVAEVADATPKAEQAGAAGSGSSAGDAPSPAQASGLARGLFTPFVEFCMESLKERMELHPYPMNEEFRELIGDDGNGQVAVSRSTAYQSEKLRQIRAADINAGPFLQVLNLIAFPRPEYDVPLLCADLVIFPRGQLLVLDLNPLFTTDAYIDKYIKPLLPRTHEYCKRLPWGGEFTAESLQFFSPALLWSRLPPSPEHGVDPAVFEAFRDYCHAWIDMLEAAQPETDPDQIAKNQEAQHRYMSWRAEKDPGRPLLTRLFGEERCERFIHDFLFDGLYTLSDKTFLDYFPQFRMPNGSVCKKRSMTGKAYTERPWDESGRLVGETKEQAAPV